MKRLCKSKGCKDQSAALGFVGGLVRVCANCERCVTHCRCDGFKPATCEDDFELAREEREQAAVDAL